MVCFASILKNSFWFDAKWSILATVQGAKEIFFGKSHATVPLTAAKSKLWKKWTGLGTFKGSIIEIFMLQSL